MFRFKFSLAHFIADLTATKSTSMVAAVVFGAIVVPISGGPIKAYEVRELRAGLAALANGETSTPQMEPSVYPRRHSVTLVSAPMSTAKARNAALVSQGVEQSEPSRAEVTVASREAPVEAALVLPVVQTFEEPMPLCNEECELEMVEDSEAAAIVEATFEEDESF